jgi:hypothetical protein
MSISANLFDPVVTRVETLESGTIAVHLGEYPSTVTVFIKGDDTALVSWLSQILVKYHESEAIKVA